LVQAVLSKEEALLDLEQSITTAYKLGWKLDFSVQVLDNSKWEMLFFNTYHKYCLGSKVLLLL
jgi:hypothetical protein